MPLTSLALAPLTAVQAKARVDALLDLSNIRLKLADVEEGPGIPDARLEVMEQEYRRFLALHLAFPDADVVPCKSVDVFWHQHILDTAAYRADCEVLFGRFLDHFPYFGMRGPQDAQDLEDAYAATIERYRAAFGEPPKDTWISINPTARCKRTACKPQKCK